MVTSHPSLAFIGGGNMAAAIIGGLLKTGWPKAQIAVAEALPERREWLQQTFDIRVHAEIKSALSNAEVVVLAVKPQQVAEALAGVTLPAQTLVISIAAGVRVATLTRQLGSQCAYVRTMPNTPALLGAGITGLYAPEKTRESARGLAAQILQACGQTVWLENEAQLDAVTALSGSGPAYFFLMVEALAEAGVALGLSPEMANSLAAQTCVGSARMVGESGQDVKTLRANVTSKGGTTFAAVEHLESAGLRTIFADALQKAADRAKAMGDALDAATPR